MVTGLDFIARRGERTTIRSRTIAGTCDFRRFLLERGAAPPRRAMKQPEAITTDHIRGYLSSFKDAQPRHRPAPPVRDQGLPSLARNDGHAGECGCGDPARALRFSPRAQRRLPAISPKDDVRRLIEADSEDGGWPLCATARS